MWLGDVVVRAALSYEALLCFIEALSNLTRPRVLKLLSTNRSFYSRQQRFRAGNPGKSFTNIHLYHQAV